MTALQRWCTATLLIITLMLSCTKQKHYPDESTTGKKVLGCYINQKEYIPCAKGLSWQLISSGQDLTSPLGSYIEIKARNICDGSYGYGRYLTIKFTKVLVQENSAYKFDGYQEGKVSCQYSEDLAFYDSDSTTPGSITIIRFDPVAKILSAKFNLILTRRDSSKVAIITKGIFDVRL